MEYGSVNGRLPDLSQPPGRKLHFGKYVRGAKARHIEQKGKEKVARRLYFGYAYALSHGDDLKNGCQIERLNVF